MPQHFQLKVLITGSGKISAREPQSASVATAELDGQGASFEIKWLHIMEAPQFSKLQMKDIYINGLNN